MNTKTCKPFIAVLGFADPITEARYPQNRLLAYSIGKEITAQGYGLAVGNFTGTFSYALAGAQHHRGTTLAIIETYLWDNRHRRTDILILTGSTAEKHCKLVAMCCGGIIIGGGNGSLHLADQLLLAGKPVIAMAGSGGIVPTELPGGVVCIDTALKAVQKVRTTNLAL